MQLRPNATNGRCCKNTEKTRCGTLKCTLASKCDRSVYHENPVSVGNLTAVTAVQTKMNILGERRVATLKFPTPAVAKAHWKPVALGLIPDTAGLAFMFGHCGKHDQRTTSTNACFYNIQCGPRDMTLLIPIIPRNLPPASCEGCARTENQAPCENHGRVPRLTVQSTFL